MTPAQIYAALAALLNISVEEAEVLANHLMALTLGRNTTDSASWRTVPPAQRNDLQTTEKMPTRLFNSIVTASASVESVVNGFSNRFTEVVGNHYPGQADEEAFAAIGNNLIQAIYNFKLMIDNGEIGAGGESCVAMSSDDIDRIWDKVFA